MLSDRLYWPYSKRNKTIIGQTMNVKRPSRSAALLFAVVIALPAASQPTPGSAHPGHSGPLAVVSKPATPTFMSLEAAQPTLHAFADSLPQELRGAPSLADWSGWIKAQDASIRERLVNGEEDTLTNLLRWGTTFTDEYQINREYLAKYGSSPLVNAFAEKRTTDLVRALGAPGANKGIQQMRAFLIQRGYSFSTAKERERVKRHLLANLGRMRDEFAGFREKLKTADTAVEGQLYAQRGISLDSNLWPDYALDRSLNELVQAGMLKPGSVRRIAVVGPGLDFANKDFGNDFYPPQSFQTFAVLDSLVHLGLTNLSDFELFTLDISPSVNIHIAVTQKAAAAGKAYVVQLPWNRSVPFSPEYLAAFEPWWQGLGGRIGTSVIPVHIPARVAEDVHIRAVSIRSEIARRITPLDMNVVYQRARSDEDSGFDLIIGTNIFIYYGGFEQSLARANLSAMLRPGGFVLTNDLLSEKVPSHLVEAHRTDVLVRSDPQIIEHIHCYRREE